MTEIHVIISWTFGFHTASVLTLPHVTIFNFSRTSTQAFLSNRFTFGRRHIIGIWVLLKETSRGTPSDVRQNVTRDERTIVREYWKEPPMCYRHFKKIAQSEKERMTRKQNLANIFYTSNSPAESSIELEAAVSTLLGGVTFYIRAGAHMRLLAEQCSC